MIKTKKLRKPLDKDLLFRLYVIEKKSGPEIGKILNCPFDRVFRHLRRYGLGQHIRDSGPERIKISRKRLYKEYILNNKSTIVISKMFNYSRPAICNLLRKYNIEIRSPSQRASIPRPWIRGDKSPTKRLEVRLKMSKNHADFRGEKNPSYGNERIKGSNNPNWKDGIADSPYPPEWNERLKEKIRKRDNYKCQKCSIPQIECIKKLHVHHKDENKQNCDESNLISLCRKCHITIHRSNTILDKKEVIQCQKNKILYRRN